MYLASLFTNLLLTSRLELFEISRFFKILERFRDFSRFRDFTRFSRQIILKISQCVPKLAKLAVFTNLLLTARLEFILGKQSPFFVTTQLTGSGSEAQSFYKLGDSNCDSLTQIV